MEVEEQKEQIDKSLKRKFISREAVELWKENFKGNLERMTKVESNSVKTISELINDNIQTQDSGEKRNNLDNLFQLGEDKGFLLTIKKIALLALELPLLFTEDVLFLTQGFNHEIILTKRQVFCLLANVFLCSVPLSDQLIKQIKLPLPPHIGMMLSSAGLIQQFIGRSNCIFQKVKCVYFSLKKIIEIIDKSAEKGQYQAYLDLRVSFKRVSLDDTGFLKELSTNKNKLKSVQIQEERGIFEIPNGICIDFANKFIGGGVIGKGCVQEEIQFAVAPEYLVSRLFCEVMDQNEAIIIIGADTFCQYKGYQDKFEFIEVYDDEQFVISEQKAQMGLVDSKKRKKIVLSAIDAIKYQQRFSQEEYQEKIMIRELKKAFVGFDRLKGEKEYDQFEIVTGNWGCGAFSGDHQLKFVLQWIAGSLTGQKIVYCTFKDQNLQNASEFVGISENLNIAEIWKLTQKYGEIQNQEKMRLFDFIMQNLKENQ